MQEKKKTPLSSVSKLTLVEAVISILLLVLTFSAVALSDVSSIGLHAYWVALVVLFGLLTFAADRIHSGHSFMHGPTALRIGLHWLGVFCGVQLVYFFVSTGRMANADTGLTNGLLLALGAFLAGVHVNWRFLIVGTAIGGAAAGIAFVDEYIWVLFGIAILAILGLAVGVRVSNRRSSSAEAGAT